MPTVSHADRTRTWGFRISVLDVTVLVVSLLGSWQLWPVLGPIAAALPVALGHFFLFCNVFRIHRTKELWWSVLFLVNAAASMYVDHLSWPLIITMQAPVTVACIVLEMRGPYYHGVFARRINRDLDRYLTGELT